MNEPLLVKQMEKELAVFQKPTWEDSQQPLWHYTDASGVKGIISEKCIRATHHAFTNDREEIVLGEKIVLNVIEELIESASGEYQPALLQDFLRQHKDIPLSKEGLYLACFCEDGGDRLSQWRAYGGAGAGYSLGFTKITLPPKDDNPDAVGAAMFAKVIYSEHEFRESVKDELRKLSEGIACYIKTYRTTKDVKALVKAGLIVLNSSAACWALRFKHGGFEEEREWRMIIVRRASRIRDKDGHVVVEHRASTRGLIPYINVNLSDENKLYLAGVRVGPVQTPDNGVFALQSLLENHYYENAQDLVLTSSIPFRG